MASGWRWAWVREPLGIEEARSDAELTGVFRAYGSALAACLRSSRLDRFNVVAFCMNGPIRGRDAWLLDRARGIFLPHDEPWIMPLNNDGPKHTGVPIPSRELTPDRIADLLRV
ncbi:hypothetical protein [Streptomyces lycii]|uniref:Uncharacterized protein n=1 Tax=Streptomyces lycii TaxID=2654337 RepID=A0ABQ7FMY1_9ACTN|nr:hypothetical protein [Streptomyces lycii]KAF4408608.1 hypothetical protein GCU69_12985 [Streptomyces lycii]